MNCRVIYDLSNGFWLDSQVEIWVILGTVGTMVPLLLISAAQSPVLRRLGRLPGRNRQFAYAILALAAIVGSLTGIARSHSVFVALRDPYLHGHFATVRGRIQDFQDETFHPTIPGDFTVRGHTFSWDPSGVAQRFSAGIDVDHFGPLSYSPQFVNPIYDGMTVRLRFIDDRILRFEALASELPAELAARLPPCDSAL